MNPTNIDYLDFTWNPNTGCFNWQNGVCAGGGQGFTCWAKTITERFKKNYPYGFEPTFYPERLLQPLKRKKPSRIGVSLMGDLFGDWMYKGQVVRDSEGRFWSGPEIMDSIFRTVEACPQHTFVFLTKCPWNLPRWNPWPGNAWVGLSATNMSQFGNLPIMGDVQARLKFVSFEPLLDFTPPDLRWINWIIVGAATGKGANLPRLEWVREIVKAADKAGIPVFLKDNLLKIYPELPKRQELP